MARKCRSRPHPKAVLLRESCSIRTIPTARLSFTSPSTAKLPRRSILNSGLPNIIAKQGTVEDWIIENRSNELHAFHIHQLHFLLLDYLGKPRE